MPVHLESAQREARHLRGRKGADIWQRFVNISREKQVNYLRVNGVWEERIDTVLPILIDILADEGIIRKEES